jgi:hypothetical protein
MARATEADAAPPPQPDVDDADETDQLAGAEKEAVDAAQVFTLRQTYWRNGYRPVPVYSRQKRPRGSGWRADALQDPPVWATRWPEDEALGTGLLTGNLTGIDVDVLVQSVNDRIVWETEQMLGTTLLVRIGLAPKILLGFRCEEDPFRKLSTGTFVMPDGSEAKVEILADGQQFVASGIHPDTRQPYLWPAGSPETVPLTDVPPITLEQAQAVIAKARELLLANGGVEKPPPSRQKRASAAAGNSFFTAVNAAALDNLAAWVRQLFPKAVYQPGTGSWRVTAKDRGRPDLEEDISFHPVGVQDFGLEHGLSPIDAVIEFGVAADAVAAAHWLCERLGIAPATLRWHDGATLDNAQLPEPEPPPYPGFAGSTPDTTDWPEPVDFMAAQSGAPILKERHVPPSLWPFIVDNAERMGVAPSSVALCAIVSCSAAINEEWRLQPKRNDWDWTEAARLWGAIVGPPSVLKSPIVAMTTKPIEMLDVKAHEAWDAEQAAHAAWKEASDETVPEPRLQPRDRYLVESATIEALQEVLRDDASGKLRAPLGKVLVRQDELEEFLANMDKYSTNNKGNDRGAWLRAYNGGRHAIDRIGRGSFATKSWSCCLLGGIQPDVIRQIARRTTDNGLIQRFMLDVPGPQPPGLDRAPNQRARDLYRALFPALAAMHPNKTHEGYTVAVALHTDAHAAREDIDALARVMAAMPDASSRSASTFGKWPGLFARLCLTFHLIEIAAARVRGETAPAIDVVTADTAARVRRYMRAVLAPSLLRAEALMFGTVQTEHAARIANYILAHRLDRVTAREIVRSYRTLRPPEERGTLNSTMDALCLFGWLAPLPPRRDGAPTITWRVNPSVHVLFAERAGTERTRLDAVKAEIAQNFAALGDDEC